MSQDAPPKHRGALVHVQNKHTPGYTQTRSSAPQRQDVGDVCRAVCIRMKGAWLVQGRSNRWPVPAQDGPLDAGPLPHLQTERQQLQLRKLPGGTETTQESTQECAELDESPDKSPRPVPDTKVQRLDGWLWESVPALAATGQSPASWSGQEAAPVCSQLPAQGHARLGKVTQL